MCLKKKRTPKQTTETRRFKVLGRVSASSLHISHSDIWLEILTLIRVSRIRFLLIHPHPTLPPYTHTIPPPLSLPSVFPT